MKIMALDLGKSKSVTYRLDTETGECAFEAIRTRPGTVERLLRRSAPDRVVFEIGPSAGWVHDVAREVGVGEIEVAHVGHEAWRWRHVKAKTDRLDAAKLVDLSVVRQLPTVHVPRKAVRQWRQLIAYRAKLVDRRTAVKNTIRAILVMVGETMPAGRGGWTQVSLERLGKMARPLETVDSQDLWRGELMLELETLARLEDQIATVETRLNTLGASNARVGLLRTIPGVGPRLAELLVALIDDPHRFPRGKQVSSYLGLVPRLFQSGAMDRHGRITRHGSRLARKLLVEVAWIGLRYNPHLRAIYERVRRGSPARKKIAIVAVARRLAVLAWAMLRDGTVWHPPAAAEPIGKRAATVQGGCVSAASPR